ncbi:MAG: Asp-tRNA(Asn)/Glu-tRNA(Gln) amidotransferase subunit GatC [Leptospirillia bacterium]
MNIERDEVLKIASLARLTLTDDEVIGLGKDLNAILGYVEKLGELDTTGVPTLEHAAEFGDTFRDDQPRPSLDREVALNIAPSHAEGCFSVPKIIE